MDYRSLQDLYEYELKELYSAEKAIHQELPQMISQVTDLQLKETLIRHREDSRLHIDWLERIFHRQAVSPHQAESMGMQGILEECEKWRNREAEPAVKDAGVISGMQRVAHYKIAGYGSVRAYADLLGLKDDADLINLALYAVWEEDRHLTVLSEKINAAALDFAPSGHP